MVGERSQTDILYQGQFAGLVRIDGFTRAQVEPCELTLVQNVGLGPFMVRVSAPCSPNPNPRTR